MILNWRSKIKNILQFAFAMGLLYWVFSSTDIKFENIKKLFSLKMLIIIGLLSILVVILGHLRWWRLMKVRNIDVNFLSTLKLTFIGIFFNFALPGAVGGDVVKVYYICRNRNEQKLDAGITVLMDRLMGLTSLVLGGFLGAVYFWINKPNNNQIGPILFVTSSLVFFLLFVTLLMSGLQQLIINFPAKNNVLKFSLEKIGKFLQALSSYRRHKREIFIALLISFFSHVIIVYIFYFIGTNIGEMVEVDEYFVAVSLGLLGSSIPISPGGIGVGQVSFYYFFKFCTGQNLQVGAIGITILQGMMFLLGLVGGLMYLRGVKVHKLSGRT